MGADPITIGSNCTTVSGQKWLSDETCHLKGPTKPKQGKKQGKIPTRVGGASTEMLPPVGAAPQTGS